MPDIEYDAPVSLSWQHPPYGKTAAEEHCEDFNLAEAVRFVMESLPPDRRVHARINAAGREHGLAEIVKIYQQPDFPRG